MLDDWCPTCQTRHEGKVPCPGPLAPTGPARDGWRITVKTNRGPESYGVQVAPADRRWLAWIVTYPWTCWLYPGSEESLKFLGDSPQDAEGQAIEHIREHVHRKGYTPVEPVSPAKPLSMERVRTASIEEITPAHGGEDAGPTATAIRRKLCSLPVRFGHNTHSRSASVENVSERGLFVNTDDPLEIGSVIRLKVELDSRSIPLRGVVVWSRIETEEGRPNGMGVRLNRPPALYISYVRLLGVKS